MVLLGAKKYIDAYEYLLSSKEVGYMAGDIKVTVVNVEILKKLFKKNRKKRKEILERFPRYGLWVKGEDYPSYEELVLLSKIYGIPFGYFFLERLPKMGLWRWSGKNREFHRDNALSLAGFIIKSLYHQWRGGEKRPS